MPVPTVSPTAMRIVQLLVGNPPQTVADLIKTSGVTRTAVTEQLDELVAAGYVEQTTERLPGRGRPRYLYSATNTALSVLFSGNQRLVVPAVWRAVKSVGGTDLLQQVVNRLAEILADCYRHRITAGSLVERVRQMAKFMQEEGSVIEVHHSNGDDNGSEKVLLHKKTCTFFSMFDTPDRTLCDVDEKMMNLLIGHPFQKIACRHDGDAYCAFELCLPVSQRFRRESP